MTVYLIATAVTYDWLAPDLNRRGSWKRTKVPYQSEPYRMHVSDRLLGQNDGSMLEALKCLNGEAIHLPSRVKDRPDRDRLALRFERFKAAA